MATLVFILILCQALGATIGAVAVVWAEIAYVRDMRDGKIDTAERAHLRAIAHGLRFGMTLVLVSSLVLVGLAYVLHTSRQPASTSSYWLLIVLALLITFVSWALSRKRISFALGSAVAFTGWWFLALLTFGQIPELSFGAAVAFFVISTAIFYVLLQYARLLAAHKK